MWGTDTTTGFTLEDGWARVFVAVAHWNAECLDWLTKHGNGMRPWPEQSVYAS